MGFRSSVSLLPAIQATGLWLLPRRVCSPAERASLCWTHSRTRRYPVIDNQTLREVKLRIMGVLFIDQIPDARDVVLIALADVCGIFSSLLSSRELATITPRIRQISKLDLIAREVASAVREIESSLVSAMVLRS